MELEGQKAESLSPLESELRSSDDEISKELSVNQTSITVPERSVTVHRSAGLPLPFGIDEGEDVVFVDPASGVGKRILSDRQTTVPEIFAVMRQFVYPVGDKIGIIVKEMLKRKVGVNDVDITTGMSMLHYVVRSEAISSDTSTLSDTIQSLLQSGANTFQRTALTDMNVFHIAAYFDCWESLEVIINSLNADEIEDIINSMASEFEFGTALHIATANLSVKVAELLIKHGADLSFQDDLGRTPESCIPVNFDTDVEREKAEKLRKMLNTKAGFFAIKTMDDTPSNNVELMKDEKEQLQSSIRKGDGNDAKLQVGDHVVVGETKRGVIRYIGSTRFSPGIWCGIELDDRLGKNDGSINGVRYFTCERSRGVFTPLSKVVRAPAVTNNSHDRKSSLNSPDAAVQKGLKSSNMSSDKKRSAGSDLKLRIGMSVLLDKLGEEGKIRFIGETDFAPGIWIGLSLGRPVGKNNGTVQGREYFQCKPKHGIMVRPSRVSVNGITGDALLP